MSEKHRMGRPMLRDEIPANAVHLCVDMQKIFAEDTPWRTPWMSRILPSIVNLVSQRPRRTIFTRFIPPSALHLPPGAWRRYWNFWREMTRERLEPRLVELVDPLSEFTPPALTLDKAFYSPWHRTELDRRLHGRCDALVITGAETDVCVLAAVLGAVDRGYRVILPTDAICSSSDETHDALLKLYSRRYSHQVETTTVAEVLAAWRK